MIITLIMKNAVFNQALPEKIQGQYWINYKNNMGKFVKLLSVEAAGNKWIAKSNREAFLCGENGQPLAECFLQTMSFYKIKISATGDYALLFCEPTTQDRKSFVKCVFSADGELKLGRSETCEIIYTNSFVSSIHAQFTIQKGAISIRDCKSANGTFVNGIRVSESQLNPGDVVFIMGLKMIIGKGFMAINNPDGMVKINTNKLLGYKSQKIESYTPSFMTEDQTVMFYRSPRFKRDIQTYELTIDPPPSKSLSEPMPMLLTIGPAVTMGMASVTMAITSIINIANGRSDILTSLPMLVMSFAMLCGTLLWPTLIKKYEKNKQEKREALRQKKYNEYINGIKSEIDKESSYQRGILNENYVSLDTCLSRIKLVQRNLWERTSQHNDFLTLRLGIGSLPLDCNIKCDKRRFSLDEDNLQELQFEISEQQHSVRSVPITLPMRDAVVTGIIGHTNDTTAFVKSLLFQLVALHSYDEVKIVVICDESDTMWNFTKWLPHIWNDEHSMRYMAKNLTEVKDLSSFLEKVAAERLNARGYNDIPINPHYVVFALSQTLADHAEFIKLICSQEKYIGFSVLAVSEGINNIPKECSRIIEINPQRSRMYDRNDVSGKFTEFTPEFFIDDKEELYATTLANISLGSNSESYKMPTVLSFTEVYDVGKIEHLNILSRWKENDPTASLDAVIGVDSMGEKISLNIHEKYHGPHGLIAGTTGSGKSEFIMTYILAMAVNYHPSEVSFILIDYKGGGMAKAFERLPHTAGIITNLDGSEVNRSLVSIQSELKRRQALFTQTSKRIGMSNIDIYKYQRLYREGTVSEPLPHLVIISDEFAELKAQQSEFMAELISTARIGRSLGVHLILATQKPTGVVDEQILSNTRFRVCLKVQDRQDSMEMLKRPDASELTATGRFYLQVGNNEIFKLGQSAWSGAHYIPSDRVEQQPDNSVSILSNTGKVLKRIRLKSQDSSQSISQLDAITMYIADLAKGEGFSQRMLWFPSIPAVIIVDDLIRKYSFVAGNELMPVVGEYDVPNQQKQELLTLHFSQGGNVAVYGSSGSGKTTFVTTLMYSLITQYTPEQVHIYAMDFASQTLFVFGKAPHVGDIILPDEQEKIQNLFKMLQSELKRRKSMFKDFGGDYISYQKLSGKSIPGIVVLIHNYTGMAENYDVEDQVAFLTREGAKCGIYFLVTAQSAEAIRHRVLQNFGQILVLRMNDNMDYSAILGNVGGLFPAKHLGRGIFKNKAVFEFQTARCIKEGETQFIRELCDKLAAEWKADFAPSIPVLPEKVDAEFMHKSIDRTSENMLPVGVDKDKLSVIAYPFFDTPISLVLSLTGEHSRFLQGLAETAVIKSDISVVVLDTNGHFDAENVDDYQYAGDKDSVNNLADSVYIEMLNRHKTLKTDANAKFDRMICIVDSLSALEDALNEKNQHNFFDVLNSSHNKYNLYFVIGDTSSYLNRIANKPWVTSHFSFRDAIWLGEGLKDDFRLQISKESRHLRDKIDANCGFVIINGKAVLSKLLVPESWMPEEDY